jgi:hypothetical protein
MQFVFRAPLVLHLLETSKEKNCKTEFVGQETVVGKDLKPQSCKTEFEFVGQETVVGEDLKH